MEKMNIDEENLINHEENSENFLNLKTNEINIENFEKINEIKIEEDKVTMTTISTETKVEDTKEFLVKPAHWTDEYWASITAAYDWFLHKDGLAGCKVCRNFRGTVGKKSLLASMQLRLMELTYQDFEKKLSEHAASSHHSKSTLHAVGGAPRSRTSAHLGLKTVSNSVNTPARIKKCNDTDFFCPFCVKSYKFKKVLAKHIYSCKGDNNTKGFRSPCDCENCILNSISAIDDHNANIHSSSYLFNCKDCSAQLNNATNLFDHLLTVHNFQWNPVNYMPSVMKVIPNTLSTSSRKKNVDVQRGRNKSYVKKDDIWFHYEEESENNASSDDDNKRPIKKTKLSNEESIHSYKGSEVLNTNANENTNLRIPYEQISCDMDWETTLSEMEVMKDGTVDFSKENYKILPNQLMLSIDQICTCMYCGGRYYSVKVLNEHISTRHSTATLNEENEEETRRLKHKAKLLAVSEALNNESVVKRTEVNTITGKRPYNRKNVAELKTNNIEQDNTGSHQNLINELTDNGISASLLTCPICPESFQTLDLRNQHVFNIHPEIEKFICQHCGLMFTNQLNFNKHLEKSHNSNNLTKSNKNSAITYSCTLCPLVFTNNADLNHHVNFSHPQDVVTPVSPVIAIDTNNKNAEVEEPVVEKEVDPLVELFDAKFEQRLSYCSICDLSFHNEFEYAVHKLSHSDKDIDVSSCPGCNRLFFGEFSKLYLKDHYNIEHLKKVSPYCNFCNVPMNSSYVLDKHQANGICQPELIIDPYQKLMSKDKLAFSCSQCGSIFAGENCSSRFEIHNEKCTLELMDDDEFLDC